MIEQDVLWAPHEGPQSTFLASAAYEVLYGGAAGGGKSDALLFGGLRQIDHPEYKALILRRTFPELQDLMDRAHGVFTQLGGVWNEREKRYTFPSGATYGFGYCETYKDVLQYQGKAFTYIAVDEIGQWPEERMWTYLMSRNRSASAGLTMQMRASANPGGVGHAWLKRRFISQCPPTGEIVHVADKTGETTSRAFVQAFLSDNPTLMQNDPGYARRLAQLPELEYKWLAQGDWDAGAGLGLADLSRAKHYIPAQPIPEHWQWFGAFDWGYAHPFSFGLFAADEDGTVYLVDSCSGRRMQPPEIADRIHDLLRSHGLTADRLRYTVAGHDCWADVRARAENIPTVFEHFVRLGLPLVKANISRVSGVQNIRRYLAFTKDSPPRFVLMQSESNRRVFETLESVVSDPDHPEDILKVDADENGEGGDDAYDMVRYGLASRPIAAPTLARAVDRDRSPSIQWPEGTVKRRSAQEEVDALFTKAAKVQRRAVATRPRWV